MPYYEPSLANRSTDSKSERSLPVSSGSKKLAGTVPKQKNMLKSPSVSEGRAIARKQRVTNDVICITAKSLFVMKVWSQGIFFAPTNVAADNTKLDSYALDAFNLACEQHHASSRQLQRLKDGGTQFCQNKVAGIYYFTFKLI